MLDDMREDAKLAEVQGHEAGSTAKNISIEFATDELSANSKFFEKSGGIGAS